MNKKMRDLINQLEDNNQSWEFYPTTKEIIQVIYNDLGKKTRYGKSYSVLDIGCGNGNFFNKFQEIRKEVLEFHKQNNIEEDKWDFEQNPKAKPVAEIDKKFAIEKSEILIQNLPKDVIVIGTDFWQQTLIDKSVDVIFCNPPYSEFEEWTVKIIKESFSKKIYLVIPERWKNSRLIKEALNQRNFEADSLGNFDFLKADRAARAKIDIVKITAKKTKFGNDYYEERGNDPFDCWFNEEFKINLNQKEEYSYDLNKKKKEEIKDQIVKGSSLTETLTEIYNRDMQKLLGNYKAVCDLDTEVLKELGINLNNLKIGLKEKIENLKNLYWRELFNNFSKITDRLISKKRDNLLSKLHENFSIDFTESNIYAIVIWVIKNSNQYFDDQLKEIYLELTETDFVKKYKSNQRTWERDRWRYKNQGTNTHYTLDYRIITRSYSGRLIDDVRVIANNLGFSEIGDVKTFQNGNIHFRFEKDFIKAFNIEASRLFGWIKEPQDILNEFDCDITQEDIDKYYKQSFLIEPTNTQLLLTCHQ